jgi:hypothetical protein
MPDGTEVASKVIMGNGTPWKAAEFSHSETCVNAASLSGAHEGHWYCLMLARSSSKDVEERGSCSQTPRRVTGVFGRREGRENACQQF